MSSNRKWFRYYKKGSNKTGKSNEKKNGKANENSKRKTNRINNLVKASNNSTADDTINTLESIVNSDVCGRTLSPTLSATSSNDPDSQPKNDKRYGKPIGSSGCDNKDDSTLDVYVPRKNDNGRFYSWKLYFEDEDKDNPVLLEKIRMSIGFMEKRPHFAQIKEEEIGPGFILSLHTILADEEFMNEWPTFLNELEINPKQTLNCLSLALRETVIKNIIEKKQDSKLNRKIITYNIPTLRVKIINFGTILSCSDIKFTSYGKLVSIRGCVMRVGLTKQLAEWLLFVCSQCHIEKIQKQTDGIYSVPKNCDNCGKSKFNPRHSSPFTKSIPFQTIKLQEQHKPAMQEDRGKMPRVIEVELFNDLVEICIPGDDVTLVGIVKIRGTDDGQRKGKEENGPNALYLEAVSVINNKKTHQKKKSICEMKDFFLIKSIHDHPKILPLLVESLCPSIFGHQMIKLGLLLSLFGGSYTEGSRNDIHMLMVGDPGLGKSQMLQACARVAPHCVYICGSSSSSAGLTISLSKEQGTSDFILEPGALVLADNGVCLIDEFDKMPTQHQALLEAMEQQSVSVAKSGVICSLPARTALIAAANPIGGRYNTGKTVTENLNLSEPLLSRFDLIFPLLDLPDTANDSLMCSHVFKFHTTASMNQSDADDQLIDDEDEYVDKVSSSLKEKLSDFNSNKEELITHEILRKYISYARTYVYPKLTKDAANILQQYYLELRKKTNIFGSLPVFHRQLEGLVRLTEARAKMELREKTTVQDALEIVELFNYTLTSLPALGTFRHLKPDGGKLTAKKVTEFIKVLQNEKKRGISKFSKEELETLAEENGIHVEGFNKFIRKLNDEGIIISQGKDNYKFISD